MRSLIRKFEKKIQETLSRIIHRIAPNHIHIQSNHLGQRYTYASIRIISESTTESHFSQPHKFFCNAAVTPSDVTERSLCKCFFIDGNRLGCSAWYMGVYAVTFRNF